MSRVGAGLVPAPCYMPASFLVPRSVCYTDNSRLMREKLMSLPDVSYARRPTRAVRVGDITIGGGHPIVVQSMITEETHNVPAAVEQIIAMHQAGAEIVRVTTPTLEEAHCLGEIQAELRRRLVDVPLVADVHHQGTKIAQVVNAPAAKVASTTARRSVDVAPAGTLTMTSGRLRRNPPDTLVM